METISIREAAERLGVSHKVVRRLVSQGVVAARKESGGHGEEWRLDVASLESYRSGAPAPAPPHHSPKPQQAAPAPAPSPPALPAPPALPSREEELLADKRFLQEQVTALTAMLGAATLPGTAEATPPIVPTLDTAVGTPSGDAPEASAPLAAQVTQALQTSLSSRDVADIRALEMCSVRLLWGKPVLWRTVAEEPADVSALLEAILSPDAAWDPPAGEVVFLWARDAQRDVVWGTACGPAWFGAPFQDALRQARVERR